MIFLDLDNLKSVNDRHGHLAGSQVLREVGYLLRRTVTDERATLTRYGGDEFVLILPGHNLEEGLEVAEAIRDAIRSATFLFRPYGFNEPALNLHGVITGVARPLLDPLPRDAGRLRRAAEERAPARRRHGPLPRQGARQGPLHGREPRGRAGSGAVLLDFPGADPGLTPPSPSC